MGELSRRSIIWRIALGLVMAVVIAGAWLLTPLRDYADLEVLLLMGAYLRESPWGNAIVIVAFVVAGLLFVPLTAPVVATALVFDPLHAFWLATAGTLLSALVGFTVGHFLGHAPLHYLGGHLINRISRGAGRHGIMVVTTLRLVPIAHFSLINLGSGATHVRLRDFVVGTVFGCVPGIAAIAIIGNEAREFARDPDPWSLLWLTGVGVIGLGMLHLLRRRMRRYSREHGENVDY